jgi:hypothetical protein
MLLVATSMPCSVALPVAGLRHQNPNSHPWLAAIASMIGSVSDL